MNASPRPLLRQSLLPLLLMLAACGGNPEPAAETPEADTLAITEVAPDTTAPAGPQATLNLNTATGDEFRTIPGVGDRMVHEFEEYRPYVSIQQFRREIGKYVDEEQVAAYEQYVFVPIDPNESDAATLRQIPGLDAPEADALIAARPYEAPAAFLEALRAYVSEDALATAETYLAAP